MVKEITENKKLKVTKREKDLCVIKSMEEYGEGNKYVTTNPQMSDFKQGHIGNCGVPAAFAALSQRPEFLEEISPKVVRTNDGITFQCNMFHCGKNIVLNMNDSLPVFKVGSGFIYSKSNRDSKLLLSCIMEKAFVIVSCNYSYDCCHGKDPVAVFRAFSDSMIGARRYSKEDSKHSLMEYIKYLFDTESSVVLSVKPSFDLEPENEDQGMHCYALQDYNDGFVKVYEPNCAPDWCKSTNKLPQELKNTADQDQGEFWVTTEDFENRKVEVTSLYSFDYYHILKCSKEIYLSMNEKVISKVACRVNVEETSYFFLNFFSNIYLSSGLTFDVFNADSNEKIELQLNSNLIHYYCKNSSQKYEERMMWTKEFLLEPKSYKFLIYRKVTNDNFKTEEGNTKLIIEKECYQLKLASQVDSFTVFDLNFEDEYGSAGLENEFAAMKVSNSE